MLFRTTLLATYRVTVGNTSAKPKTETPNYDDILNCKVFPSWADADLADLRTFLIREAVRGVFVPLGDLPL